MRLSVVVIVLLGFLSSCDGSRERRTEQTSLVSLLVDPGSFNGRRIQVIGFLHHPNLRLYLTREHSEAGDVASSVIVRDSSSDGSLIRSNCIGNYARIVGEFKDRELFPELVFNNEDVCWKIEK